MKSKECKSGVRRARTDYAKLSFYHYLSLARNCSAIAHSHWSKRYFHYPIISGRREDLPVPSYLLVSLPLGKFSLYSRTCPIRLADSSLDFELIKSALCPSLTCPSLSAYRVAIDTAKIIP
ncbi:hypothetical protein R1flu_014093 [Riccia fluitans]|uniref:Uncharacterized protein n=1 Tax=Riccia fluitans TaxID=41844 RepID=A0ABD1YIV3_9MARC